jgi:hypothetical protein
MTETPTGPPHRPRGSKTKHRLDGIYRKCKDRAWPQCDCLWHLGFTCDGHPCRYSLNKWAGNPTLYHMANSHGGGSASVTVPDVKRYVPAAIWIISTTVPTAVARTTSRTSREGSRDSARCTPARISATRHPV